MVLGYCEYAISNDCKSGNLLGNTAYVILLQFVDKGVKSLLSLMSLIMVVLVVYKRLGAEIASQIYHFLQENPTERTMNMLQSGSTLPKSLFMVLAAVLCSSMAAPRIARQTQPEISWSLVTGLNTLMYYPVSPDSY